MRTDVLVIGAGPAGSAAACALARGGVDVTLVDRDEFPRDKTCGDALLPDALAAIDRLGLLDRVTTASRRLGAIRIYAPNGKHVTLDGEFGCVPRSVLDDLLLRAAAESGARFVSQLRLAGSLFGDGMVRGARFVDLREDRQLDIEANVTLLATGAAPQPLETFGVCERRSPSAVAARAYFKADESFARAHDYLCIGYPKEICPGYGWIFPGPEGTFNVGVGKFLDAPGSTLDENLRGIWQRFVKGFEPARSLMAHAKQVSPLSGSPLRTALAGSKLASRGLLVIGEAAGLTYSFSGEGIGKAMESGLLAADCIAGTPGRSDVDLDAIAEGYARELRERFRERFRAYEIAQRWLARPRVVNFLAWRARSGNYARRQLQGLVNETTDPRALFSFPGLLKSLLL